MRYSLIAVMALGCVESSPQLTPLIVAVRRGDAATIRDLLARGADPNEPAGNNNWTPMLHAIHTHRIRLVAALLDGGADVNRLGGDGMTPLMMAAGYGYDDIVQLLLQRGADPGIPDSKGFHAIDLAVAGIPDADRFTLFQCQDETVRLLRAAAPSIRIDSHVATWGRVKRCHIEHVSG